MKLRDTWQKVKKANEKILGEKFFGHMDLGRLLDSAEKAEADYKKVPGSADEAKLKKARKKVYDAYAATERPVAVYLKNISMARKANAGDKATLGALDDVYNVLSMKIAAVTDEKLKLYKSR